MGSGPAMSSERPAAPAVSGARARYSIASRSAIGWVRLARQAGSGSTRRRSTSRTSIRKEAEREPITIEARSAVAAGACSSRISSTSSLRRQVRRDGTVGRHDPAQVDHPLDAGGRRRAGEGPGGAAVARREVGRVRGSGRRRLHGMHQVVGGRAAVQGGGHAFAADHVARHGLQAGELAAGAPAGGTGPAPDDRRPAAARPACRPRSRSPRSPVPRLGTLGRGGRRAWSPVVGPRSFGSVAAQPPGRRPTAGSEGCRSAAVLSRSWPVWWSVTVRPALADERSVSTLTGTLWTFHSRRSADEPVTGPDHQPRKQRALLGKASTLG